MIDAVVYGGDGVRVRSAERREELEAVREANGTAWVRATEASTEELDRVAEVFGIHPLAVEDVVNNVRPKTEEFTEYTFVLVKEAELARGAPSFEEEVRDEPVGVFLGDGWVCTLSTDAIEAVDRIWRAVERGDGRLLKRGPDFTAYRVVDALVDEYFDLLDYVESEIESIEETVLVSTDIETLERINAVRRDLLAFRKTAWPTREAIGVLARGDPDQIRQENEKYYRDVYDHLVHVVDLVGTYRDLVNGARDIYLNTVAQSTNEVMKTLTVVATIFLPLTFIAGIYGMNFADGAYAMPELGWDYGYPAAMAGMALVGVLMLAYFRRAEYI